MLLTRTETALFMILFMCKYQIINSLKQRIKDMKDDEKPILKMKFNNSSSQVKEEFKNKFPKYYDKLFN